jgi:hypothetical protein
MLKPYEAAKVAWNMVKFQRHLKNGAQFYLSHRFRSLGPMPP